MGLVVTTPPTAEPITSDEAKLHLKVDDGADDSLISALIVAARRWCEERLGQQLLTATFTLTIDHFPSYGCGPAHLWEGGLIELPKPPLISVSHASPITSVKYYDAANAQQTLDPSKYDVDPTTKPGRLRPSFNNPWPITYRRMGAVEIVYTAGYGAAADVPQTIKQAMLLLIGHWYESRQAVGTVTKSIEFTIDALLGVEWHGAVSLAGVPA